MDHKLLQATVIHFNEKRSKTLIEITLYNLKVGGYSFCIADKITANSKTITETYQYLPFSFDYSFHLDLL